MLNIYPLSLGLLSGLLCIALAPAQAQAPTLTGVLPATNACAAPRSSSVVATFSQPLTAASAAALKVFSSQRGGLRGGGAGTVAGNTLTFVPTAYDFRPGETVQVTLTRTAASTGGTLATPRVHQFTTAAGGTGRGSFGLGTTLPSIDQPNAVAIGEVTGDNLPDMLATNRNGRTVSLYYGDGQGGYLLRQDISVGISPADLALGDLDGDGDLDFVTANFTSGTLSVRLNDGGGLFLLPSAVAEPAIGGNPSAVALGDLDGDGDLDVVVGGSNGITLVRLLNDGAGNFSSPLTLGGYGDSGDVALSDVDNDGDLDALTVGSPNLLCVYLNPGSGTLAVPIAMPLSGGPTRLALGDVDADGLPDVVVSCTSANTVRIGHNSGNAQFTFGQTLAVTMQPRGVTLGDVDADGDLDVAVASSIGQRIAIWHNSGAGVFSSGNVQVATGNPSAVALGDVDGDGDLDLLTTNYGTSTLLLRLNDGTGPLATSAATRPALACFPNPATGWVQLSLPAPARRAELLNALGQVVRVARATSGTTLLDVAGLAPGLYVVYAAGQVARLVVE